MTTTTVDEGLRAWAKGMYPTEAAVELLIRTFGSAGPWVQPADWDDRYWIDVDVLVAEGVHGPYSGGERRVLAIVASLLGGEEVDLNDALPGLDRGRVQLVLAAMAHAAGTHEHSDMEIDPERGVYRSNGYLPSLYPWPDAQ